MKRIQILLTLGLLLSLGASLDAALEPAQVDTLVAPYLKVQSALAGDDLSGAQTAARTLAEAVATISADELSALQAATATFVATDHLEKARAAFQPLSKELLQLVETVGTEATGDLHLAFCPMALGYTGAAWIQQSKTIMNPYEGSRMLHCGTIQKDLKP